MEKTVKYIPGISCNKRKAQDSLCKALRWIGVSAWAVMLLMLVLYGRAIPKVTYDPAGQIDIDAMTSWDPTLTNVLLALMFVGLLISLAGLKIKQLRTRRRSDEYMYSLYLLAVTSLGGIVYYFWFLY